MKLKKLLLIVFLLANVSSFALQVKVTMNSVSPKMSLKDNSGREVTVGTASGNIYTFEAEPGKYFLTAYTSNGSTENGKIALNIVEGQDNEFSILTHTAYVSNTDDNGAWTVGKGDYEFKVKVTSREGESRDAVYGNSSTTGRNTFLSLVGDSYYAEFIPSEKHRQEGYTTLYKGGTATANVNVNGKIPEGRELTVTFPADAGMEIGIKFAHFTDFSIFKPISESVSGNIVTRKYFLGVDQAQSYNYRTWKEGGITLAGYFFLNSDPSLDPQFNLSENDYKVYNPKQVNHDVNSNKGYETGNIFLNINPCGHLKLNIGDSFDVHAMRVWEISDNATNNYFIEPDFHYTIVDCDGRPSNNVIRIEHSNPISPWSEIKAVGKGTVIVTVSYDALCLNYYKSGQKNEYMGGEFWGAIWPENTGVFIVSVGEDASSVVPNMVINEKYNSGTQKLSGINVDAEHDVFYYPDTEEGFAYTFTPTGVESVTIAYPSIGENCAEYKGFSDSGVTKNADDSYTVLLKKGRQIVRMTDSSKKSVYQVLNAKPCHREIINDSRKGSNIYQPGDKVTIQYSGLFHPADKLAGIYNMSAYITYNGKPNGSSLILGAGQYTFGSAPSAQAVTVDIPESYDAIASPEIVMSEGVIQVNGYGDPIGNHRNTDRTTGRSPNFTAVAHKTYFGSLPDVRISVTPVRTFHIILEGIPDSAQVELTYKGKPLEADDDGHYNGSYGDYSLVVKADGYRCLRKTYNIPDNANGHVTFKVEMEELGDAWDGVTKTEPKLNADSTFIIEKGAELAWFADYVNSKGENQHAVVINDLHLGNSDWTPIGSASATAFTGTFDGQGHKIEGLYINATTNYHGLFGYVKDAIIEGVTVDGSVSAKQYVGGLAGCAAGSTFIDRCANHADVTGSGTYTGGLIGYLNSATDTLINCYNTGTVTGTSNCGGVIGGHNASAIIKNIFNVGTVSGTSVGACIGGSTSKTNANNVFATSEYKITDGHILVSEEQMASGEIAFRLGEAFGQRIGTDPHPILGGDTVLYDSDNHVYYNKSRDDDNNGDDDQNDDGKDDGTNNGNDNGDKDDGNNGDTDNPDNSGNKDDNETDGYIEPVADCASPEIYYNIHGIGSTRPWKGYNLVRMADDSIRKIFLK